MAAAIAHRHSPTRFSMFFVTLLIVTGYYVKQTAWDIQYIQYIEGLSCIPPSVLAAAQKWKSRGLRSWLSNGQMIAVNSDDIMPIDLFHAHWPPYVQYVEASSWIQYTLCLGSKSLRPCKALMLTKIPGRVIIRVHSNHLAITQPKPQYSWLNFWASASTEGDLNKL